MNAFRLTCALLASSAALVPAAAQDNAAAPATSNTAVGPRELENFSLEGRVTRPAEQTQQPAPSASPPAASEAPSDTTAAPPSRDGSESRPVARTAASDQARTAARAPDSSPTLPDSRAASSSTASAIAPPRTPLVTPSGDEQSSSSLLVWVAALLFALGAAVVTWFVRQGRSRTPAMAGGYQAASPAPAPQPSRQPAPQPLPRSPAPAPAGEPLVRRAVPTTLRPKPDAPVSSAPPGATQAPKPVGIVASSLRPWIDVELVPDRALVDDNGAAIAFNVTLVNSGSAPARDVSIDACLLNAGAKQDGELSEFYQRPKAASDPIPMIAPMSRVPLRTAVKIPRDMIQEYEVEGRKLFMPMVAVSTRYRWSSGEGQTGVSFLIGKGGEEQARLAPFRIDQGARSWKGLGARRYEKGLRR